ncbi:hypothetical protein LguiA_033024 [Lonicera macranthoides]
MIGEVGIDPLDQAFYLPNQVSHFKTNLVLLKNQIQFFVLNNFFQSAFHGCPPMRFLEFCVNYMASSIIPIKDSGKLLRKVKEYLNLGHELKNLVDLLRIFHLPSTMKTTSANVEELISIPNAVQLQEAGVQLLKVSSSDYLLGIKFTKGVLEILMLIGHDYFELIMRNIFVLESYHYPYQSYIGYYDFFLQMLVDTDKDANLLIQNDIIKDWLG